MFSILVSILFASCVCFVRGQDSCQANSECKSIYECPQLLAIANKPSRTQEDTNFLLQAKCGYIGRIPAVCCPQDGCTTPVGTSGKCININKCSHIAAMLVEPVPQETIAYIRTLRCQGSEQFSICCVENPNVVVTPPPISGPCQSSVSAFPPDPKSGCCGVDSRVGDKIFGGTETGIDEYPWLVLIEYTRGTVVKTMCGGSLISGKYVLTAGHCVAGKILTLGTPSKVRLGEYDSSNEGRDCVPVVGGGTDCTDGVERFTIERTIPHPQYDPSDPMRRNDIALIRLEKMAPFTDFIRPICLPTTDFTASPPPNFTLFAAGWGAVSERQSSSKVKLHVDLPFLTQEQCQPSFTPFKVQLWKGQLCAGGVKGKDSCKGDSGGPLMHENGRVFEEIGIVSYGSLYCGTENFPAIYTKVFEYLDWIRSNIRA